MKVYLDAIWSRVYGWPITPEEPTAPTGSWPTPPIPEPSPIDKALDEKIKEAEFIARRKAKRDRDFSDQDAMDRLIEQDAKDEKTERALDRAMSRCDPHGQDMSDRLRPYRGAA